MSYVTKPLILTSSDPPRAQLAQPQDFASTITFVTAPSSFSPRSVEWSSRDSKLSFSIFSTVEIMDAAGDNEHQSPSPDSAQSISSEHEFSLANLDQDISPPSSAGAMSPSSSGGNQSDANPTPCNTLAINSPDKPASPSLDLQNMALEVDERLLSNLDLGHDVCQQRRDILLTSLPKKTHEQHQRPIRAGQYFALYTLVPLSQASQDQLKSVIARNTTEETTSITVRQSPFQRDFSRPGQLNLHDIYEHHVAVLDYSNSVTNNPFHIAHSVAGRRFVIVPHENWTESGLLILEFDYDGEGTLGITRCLAKHAVSLCLKFERSGAWAMWRTTKRSEIRRQWGEKVPGYEDSELKWQGFDGQ